MQEQRPGPPDLSPGAARVVAVEGALTVPPHPDADDLEAMNAGVLWPDGRLVAEAVTWRTRMIHTRKPAMPEPQAVDDLPGTWLFLGSLANHFGHFITESLARAWALGTLGERIDGALYIPMANWEVERTAAALLPHLPLLGVDVPARVLTAPARVGRLLVPTQGLGLYEHAQGSEEFRDFIRRQVGRGIAPDGPERLYVSRSRLPGDMVSILAERTLEERLEAEGYVVFHPQEHDLGRQIATLRAARDVIGVDGTPFHLLAYVGDNLRRAAVIGRSAEGYEAMFARQLRAFRGAEARPILHLRRRWAPVDDPRPRRDLWGEVDFAALGESLREAGLIRDASFWPALTEAKVAAEVARIEAARGVALRPLPAAGVPN